MSLSHLPEELILYILDFCTSKELVLCREVSNSFRLHSTLLINQKNQLCMRVPDYSDNQDIIYTVNWFVGIICLTNKSSADIIILCQKIKHLYVTRLTDAVMLTDISMFRNIHTLYMNRTQVTDVSALRGIHTLDMRNTQVTDVSALGNARIFR